jgi:thioredoxin-like negative regulator of GroEL
MVEPVEVDNREDFESKVLDVGMPVAVEFYHPRDARSKQLSPTFRQLAAEFVGRMRFFTVDVSVADLLCADYRIKRTPTVILFVNGHPAARWTNEQNITQYRQAFESQLAELWTS